MTADPVERALLEMLSAAPAGDSLAPEQVARAIDAEAWRRALPKVRAAAVRLARSGGVVILRHGKPADPETLKGVYRLRLP